MSGVLQWPGMRSEYALIPPHEGETTTRPGQVGVAFSGHQDVAFTMGGIPASATYPGGSTVISGGADIVWSRVRETTEALEIYPEPSLLRDLAASSSSTSLGASLDIEPRIGVADPVVLGIASRLRRVHTSDGGLSDVASSSLAHLLGRHLLRHYGGIGVDHERRHTRLDWRSVSTVHELVEADLAGTITLDRLSGAVYLSPFHFARAFTATVGMPPHRYVVSRRIDRARLLLSEGHVPVEEVATAVGFANLSHFRRVFRQHTGLRPSEFRAKAG